MSMERIMELGSINTTPDKTQIKRTRNSISVKNVGCKGRVKEREECRQCARLGAYQAGILAWMPCCNREDGWRKIEGETKLKCKHFKEREGKDDVHSK